MVATIHPIGDLLRSIGGDAVQVEVLLPPRASPNTWEATPSQIRLLASAYGFVSVGAGLDGWLTGLLPSTPTVRTLQLADGLDLEHDAHGHGADGSGDPHVWLDPILVRDGIVPVLADYLVAASPGRANEIGRRAAVLSDSLTALDAWIHEELSSVGGRRYVATHGAWTYYSARYDLESLGSVYERPGHEPSAAGLARLVRGARAAGLTAVLAEPQLAGTGAEALAEELGIGVVVVDPLGGPGLPERDHYVDMMRFNTRAFAEAMAPR